MSKGSQKKRPVDPDLQDRMKQAIDPEYEVPQRKPWFDQEAPVGPGGPALASRGAHEEVWIAGGFKFLDKNGSSMDGEILCVKGSGMTRYIPVVENGNYVIRRQFGDRDDQAYVNADRVLVVTLDLREIAE